MFCNLLVGALSECSVLGRSILADLLNSVSGASCKHWLHGSCSMEWLLRCHQLNTQMFSCCCHASCQLLSLCDGPFVPLENWESTCPLCCFLVWFFSSGTTATLSTKALELSRRAVPVCHLPDLSMGRINKNILSKYFRFLGLYDL